MNALSFTYQERARRFVNENMLVCQSVLLTHLFENNVSGFSWDNVTNLYDDSTEAVEEYLMHQSGLEAVAWHELPFDEREALAREHGFEPEPQEVYEWWVVTSYVAECLSQIGQPILENDFGTWWGRTCSGQAIYMDHVIRKLLRDGFEPS